MKKIGDAAVPAVFLDRDGTVMEDVGYLSDPGGVRLLPEAGGALRRLQEAGYRLVIVTNQSGVGRGMFAASDVEKVNERLRDLLRKEGVALDGVYVCPHRPEDGCSCRKPAPGLILRAADELGIDLSRSFMVGDKDSDVEAGRAAGCRTVRLIPGAEGPPSSPAADAAVENLAEAADWILGEGRERG